VSLNTYTNPSVAMRVVPICALAIMLGVCVRMSAQQGPVSRIDSECVTTSCKGTVAGIEDNTLPPVPVAQCILKVDNTPFTMCQPWVVTPTSYCTELATPVGQVAGTTCAGNFLSGEAPVIIIKQCHTFNINCQAGGPGGGAEEEPGGAQ
jgi:hypothetical protein